MVLGEADDLEAQTVEQNLKIPTGQYRCPQADDQSPAGAVLWGLGEVDHGVIPSLVIPHSVNLLESAGALRGELKGHGR